MSQNITATANAIASKLQELPQVNRMYPYPQPMSNMGFSEGSMGIIGASIPITMGSETLHTVTWQVVIKMGSAINTDIEATQHKIQTLLSAEIGEGIIGTLRDPVSRQALHQYGDPIVSEDGVDVSYDADADGNIITLVECVIEAQVPVGGN